MKLITLESHGKELYIGVFCDWLISLIVLSSRFIHVVVRNRISLLYKAESHSITYLHCTLFNHYLDAWATSTFWLFRIMLVWTWVCKYVCENALSILLCLYSEVDLIDHIINSFLNFEDPPDSFHSGCSILHPHWTCTSVPISPHPWQPL